MADKEKKDVSAEASAKAEETTPQEETASASAKSSEEAKDVEIPKKFKSLVESIEQLSVLDLSELVKVLEEKFGVSAAAPVAVAPSPTEDGNGGDNGEEAKSSYNVVLSAVGTQKIEVIKATRDATGQGLKEAKDLVDAAASSPQVVKESATKEEADELKSKFEAAGATVELQ